METLIDYLEMWEARKPDQTLYRFVDVEGRELEHYTYQSFAERTRELAAYLYAEAGLRRGDRALLVYPRVWKWWRHCSPARASGLAPYR